MKLILPDTESGGLDPKNNSLLTFHAKVFNDNFEIIDQLSLAIKHPYYKVTAEALSVNKIDLIKHDAIAIPVANCQVILDNFLMNHASNEKLILVGHNVIAHDEQFIRNTFNTAVWDSCISYHRLDT